MPLKLAVGLSKKVGQPDYGSLGASCHIEFELDQSLMLDDPEALQERIKNAYTACRQAVSQELACRQAICNGHANGLENGSEPSSSGQASHRATQKQLDYAGQLAGQIRGLGMRRLETLANKMFSKPLADLSSLDASGLIDMLKELKAGNVELASALDGAAA